MQSHKVAILHAVLGTLLTCLFTAGFLFGSPATLQDLSVLGAMLVLPLASVIGGIGLLRRRYWGYVTVLILSVIWLFVFPVGTLLGGFGLWVLVKETPHPAFPGPAETAETGAGPSLRIE